MQNKDQYWHQNSCVYVQWAENVGASRKRIFPNIPNGRVNEKYIAIISEQLFGIANYLLYHAMERVPQ